MAIVSNTFSIVSVPDDGVLFYKSLQSEDVTGAETIVAAVSGKTHYITHLLIHTDAAMDISIGSGAAAGALTTVHIGPVPLDATGGIFVWKAPEGFGLQCTNGSLVAIDSTAAGTIWIEARGKTCEK
jgi:hypothetical protein